MPGDVFREYVWWNDKGDAGESFRVGGKQGEKHPDRGWALDYIDAPSSSTTTSTSIRRSGPKS